MKNTDENPAKRISRRSAVRAISSGAAALALAAGGRSASAQESKKSAGFKSKVIHPEGVDAAHPTYSPAILAEGSQALFVSGQGPSDYTANPETQIRQTMERIGEILKAAGATWKNVVMVRSYFLNMKRDLPVFRKVRADFFVDPPPASTAVGVTELAIEGLQVEIEVMAIL